MHYWSKVSPSPLSTTTTAIWNMDANEDDNNSSNDDCLPSNNKIRNHIYVNVTTWSKVEQISGWRRRPTSTSRHRITTTVAAVVQARDSATDEQNWTSNPTVNRRSSSWRGIDGRKKVSITGQSVVVGLTTTTTTSLVKDVALKGDMDEYNITQEWKNP
ncbi:hypothetical protein CBL_13780 [Carabus blaptoides fortunei]